MARRETVVYSCDLHDGDMTDDVQTVSFGLDGRATSSTRARSTGASCRTRSRPTSVRRARAGGSGGSAPRRASRGTSRPSSGGSDREEVQRIREWARANGHQVSERGRLSSSVLEAYRAAN